MLFKLNFPYLSLSEENRVFRNNLSTRGKETNFTIGSNISIYSIGTTFEIHVSTIDMIFSATSLTSFTIKKFFCFISFSSIYLRASIFIVLSLIFSDISSIFNNSVIPNVVAISSKSSILYKSMFISSTSLKKNL